MKIYIVHSLLFLLLHSQSVLGWGGDGHRLIAKKAVTALPAEMQQFSPWFTFIIEHSIDPDMRRKTDSTEGPKHYINIDDYKEFRNGEMIWNRAEQEKKYGKDSVIAVGILPWAILDTYHQLIAAFESGDAHLSEQLMADLSHYLADAHQPMHNIANHNGQLSDQKGIHGRYESDMLKMYLNTIDSVVWSFPPIGFDSAELVVPQIITRSHINYPVIFNGDLVAARETGHQYNDQYLKIMWFYTRDITVDMFSRAIQATIDFYYSAWVKAGKPDFLQFK